MNNPDKYEHSSEAEQELVRRAQEGDERSWRQLVAPHERDIKAFINAGLRNASADPLEVYFDVLTRTWQNLHRFDPQYSFRRFLFGIAGMAVKRECLRTRGRTQSFSDFSDGSESRLAGDVPEEPDESSRAANVAGIGRFQRPDTRVHSSAVLREMLTAMLSYGGYPHQQVAFSFSIAVWGSSKKETASKPGTGAEGSRRKVPITGDPEQVVESIGAQELARSGRQLREFLVHESQMADEDLDLAFSPFSFRMTLLGRELFAKDVVSRKLFSSLADDRTGETRLEQYFGKNPRKSVADWTEGVKSNTFKALSGKLDLRRIPLPFPESTPR